MNYALLYPLNTLRHDGIYFLKPRIVLQQGEMMTNDILIVTYGRTRLRITRTDVVNFGCHLINERKHYGERDIMLTENLLTHRIAMIDEITAIDSCKMEIYSISRRKAIHLIINWKGKVCQ